MVLTIVKGLLINRKEMKALDDSVIVDLYLRRDEAAICETAGKYGNKLRMLAWGILRDQETAEECENDTYMEAWNSIPPHEPRTYFYPFLARIARNLSLNRCRDRERLKRTAFVCELSAEMEQCIPSPDDLECRMDAVALAEAINGFLGMLDAERRNIFIRRYWFLDSVADIAKRFGVTQSKVKTTLFRCRKQLKAYLEKEGYTL